MLRKGGNFCIPSYFCLVAYKMSKDNPNLDTQVIMYLHPKYYRLFIADCHASICSKAEKAREILNKRYGKKEGK